MREIIFRVTATDKEPPGRIAGIDYGTVRIGIAITDPEQRLASPFENYTRRGSQLDARYFGELANEERISLFVVGLPVHLSGEESPKSREARRFGAWLQELTGVPVVYFDERFTSTEAEQLLATGQFTKKKRKARLDMLAAQIMLSGFLESRERGEGKPGGLDDNGR